MYTNVEMEDIIFIYGRAHEVYHTYEQIYSNRKYPSDCILRKLINGYRYNALFGNSYDIGRSQSTVTPVVEEQIWSKIKKILKPVYGDLDPN